MNAHPIEDDPNLSEAEKRHGRVKRWTKKVNIFEKDFLIVPINEANHWFVIIICQPGQIVRNEKYEDKTMEEDMENKGGWGVRNMYKVLKEMYKSMGGTVPESQGARFPQS